MRLKLCPTRCSPPKLLPALGKKSPAVIFIAALAPGGLAQTRYLCKRLRARFPNPKIAVGRWGTEIDDSKSLLLAGADKVGTTIIETREHIIQLCHTRSDSKSQIEPAQYRCAIW